MTLFYVVIAISILFIAALAVRRVVSKRICAICAAIAISWLSLLLLQKMGRFDNDIILALLMGQSISGLYYLLRSKVPVSLRIYTLPFFLSLTVVFYALITGQAIVPAFAFVAAIWAVAWLVFAWRHDPGKKPLADQVMDCCGDKQ